ncbi:MAG TPA: methyltransferase [Thermoanaerobaculia bacterium]|nr:methyltransferase [Thermoanaerobaculia bacterium]
MIPEWVDLVRRWIAVLFVISLPPAILYWFIIHPFIGFWRRAGLWATYTFLTVFYLGSMAGLFLLRDRLLLRDLGTRLPLTIAALPLIVVAVVISRKRKKYLTFRILAGMPEIAPGQHGIGLLREGIYSRIRHPRYVEFSLALVGYALFANFEGLYWMTAGILVLLFVIVLMEERELRERFGQEYIDYSAKVPRFIPRR